MKNDITQSRLPIEGVEIFRKREVDHQGTVGLLFLTLFRWNDTKCFVKIYSLNTKIAN